MGQDNKSMPRWAVELGEKTWEKINQLLHDGFDTPDVMSKLSLPPSKLRSLQIYARKFGPRRRLIRFAMFRDAMAAGVIDCKDDFAKSLSVIAAHAVSSDISPRKQRQAMDAMTRFTRVFIKMMDVDSEQEKERASSEIGEEKLDGGQVVARILERYGVTPDDVKGGS